MGGRNLKADQVELSKLIVSGSRLLVYSSSVSSDVTGSVDHSMFPFDGIGTDVFCFFSGVVGSQGSTSRGTYVFAGDVFFSGSASNVSGSFSSGGLTVDDTEGYPENINSASAAYGSSSNAARRDHVHSHGELSGSFLHALATTSTHGFMDSAEKIKLASLRASGSGVGGELAFRNHVVLATNASTYFSGVYTTVGAFNFNPNDYSSYEQGTYTKFVCVGSITSGALAGDVVLFDMDSSVTVTELLFTGSSMMVSTRLSSSNLSLSGSGTMYEVRIRVMSGATNDDKFLCTWAGFEVSNYWNIIV